MIIELKGKVETYPVSDFEDEFEISDVYIDYISEGREYYLTEMLKKFEGQNVRITISTV